MSDPNTLGRVVGFKVDRERLPDGSGYKPISKIQIAIEWAHDPLESWDGVEVEIVTVAEVIR